MFLCKRNGIYYLWYRDDAGKKHKVSTGAKVKADALGFLRTFDQESRHRKNQRILLSAFTKDLFEYVRSNMAIGTLRIYESAFHHFLQLHGDLPLQALTLYHFDRFKNSRLKQVSPVTVNIELRSLKAALAVARRWKMIDANVCEGLLPVHVPQRVAVFYSKEDLLKLLGGIREQWLRRVVLMSALTGMRQGEILSLRWTQIDLINRFIHIESDKSFRTKAGKRRTIPISDAASRLLSTIEERDATGLVFTLNGNPLLRRWVGEKLRRYVRKLGLNRRLNFHSLRHSFASWLAMDGVSIYQISKLLGHSDVSVTQDFYAHLQPDSLREAVNKITIYEN